MESIRPVQAGEEVSASWANQIVEAANMQVTGLGVSEGAGGFAVHGQPTVDQQYVYIKPHTGTTLQKYQVGYLRDTSTSMPNVLTVEAATGPYHPLFVVNAHTSLSAGVVGRGTLAMYKPAKAAYTGTAPQVGDSLGPQPGTTYLKKGYQGFIAASAGTAGYVKVLQVTARKPYLGKLDADLTNASQATVSIYNGSTDSGTNITARTNLITSAITMTSGSWVVVDQPFGGGAWYITNIIRPRINVTAVVDVQVTNESVVQYVRTLVVERASTSTSQVVASGTTCTASP